MMYIWNDMWTDHSHHHYIWLCDGDRKHMVAVVSKASATDRTTPVSQVKVGALLR